MNTRRTTNILIAGAALAALAAAPASEAGPGPDSEAGASAAEVEGVLTVSGTDASTEGDGSASATVVGLGDEDVVGGSQEGNGSNGGEVLTTGETDNGTLTVGGWNADVSEDRSSSRSSVVSGRGSGEDSPSVTVLESSSEARADGSRASTTGATVSDGGDNRLTLLHAESSSSGEGSAYLIGLNGQLIATSEDANGECQVEAAPLADVLCLYANATAPDGEGDGTDGTAPVGSTAGVADADVADDNILAGLFTTTAQQQTAPDGSGTSTPSGDPETDPLGAPSSEGDLPRTGGGILTSVLGLVGMGGAAALKRWGS